MIVDPAVPATAVRVNTHERMSGVPSDWVPSSVQPAGVVAVVALLAVMISNKRSPAATAAGTVIAAPVPRPVAWFEARKAGLATVGATSTTTSCVTEPDSRSSSVTVNVTE